MYRILTVGREYGSGGGPIAALVAKQLGWQLLDNALIEKIAQKAQVDPNLAGRYDECLDSWFHRLTKGAFGRGAVERVAPVALADMFDAEAMAELAGRVIEEASEIGNCVIVGRGAQCILQDRNDAFHVFVYAPLQERIRRLRESGYEDQATRESIEEMDRLRAAYIHHHFQAKWRDPHLYHMMICATCGDEAAALAIRCAMGIFKETSPV